MPKHDDGETELILFKASWCPVCRFLEQAGTMKYLTGIFDRVRVVDLSHGETKFSKDLGIKALPSFVYLKDGRVVKRTSGFKTAAELASWVSPF